MKRKIIISGILLVALFAYSIRGSQTLSAVNAFSLEEEKVYSSATLEDEFADDTVLVTLRHDVSLNFRRYDVSDFEELGLADVRNLTSRTEDIVQKQLARGGEDSSQSKEIKI